MSMNEKKVPKRRFKEFQNAGAWEQRKLHNETNSIDTGKSKFVTKERGPYEILGSTSVIGYDDTYDYEGDFLLTARVGANAGELYRHTGKVKISDNTVFIQGDNLDFTYYLLMNFDIKKLSFGTGQPLVKASELKEQNLMFPSINEERVRIGMFFRKFDNLIILHQRKLDKLKSLKKAYLTDMFPAEGDSKPKLRFAGFTDDWEQRKAKELCSITTGQSNTQDQIDGGIYPFFIRSDIPVRSNKYLYDCEAVITIGDGNIGKVFHYINGKFDLHQRCYKMADFQDIWGKYFYYFFSTKFYDRAMKMTAKATVDSVRLEMISEMDIYKPHSIKEQQLIADYFTNFDYLITLHQRKLEKLQNIKKAYLNEMFV